jgi:hypothetical protein
MAKYIAKYILQKDNIFSFLYKIDIDLQFYSTCISHTITEEK